jgi:hypothetical protein
VLKSRQERADLRGLVSAREVYNALDVVGLRKQVHQMQLLDAISGSEQNDEIAGQRCGIA